MISDQMLNFYRIQHHSLKIDYDFLSAQVRDYQASEEYQLICKAYDYYNNKHDIEIEGRMQLGSDGQLEPVTNAYDERLLDNQFAKCVDQKRNFLLGADFTLTGENESYIEKLNEVFDRKLRTKIANTATDTIIASEVYWHPYYDGEGNLDFKKLDRRQVLVFWNDDEKTDPHSFVRFYKTSFFDGISEKPVRHLDYYTPTGVTMWEDDKLIAENQPYTYVNGEAADYWEGRLPLITWRLNATGRLLFKGVKNTQDALNLLKSQLANIALEDARSTILWIENYGGEMEQGTNGRKTLRQVISETGLICTVTVDGVGGGVRPISIEFEPEKRMMVVDMLKRTIVDNMRGFDVKDLRDASAPNQMNIKAVYSDLAEDAKEMENQLQSAFDDLLYFINRDLGTEGEDADIIFNKDMMMNESEVIEDVIKSKEVLPLQTLIEQHPWVIDVEQVMDQIKKERKEQYDEIMNYQSGGSPFRVGQEDES